MLLELSAQVCVRGSLDVPWFSHALLHLHDVMAEAFADGLPQSVPHSGSLPECSKLGLALLCFALCFTVLQCSDLQCIVMCCIQFCFAGAQRLFFALRHVGWQCSELVI